MRKTKENVGAWIIHHGKKLALDTHGASEYPAIDQSAKASTLLAKMGETGNVTLKKDVVRAIAKSNGLNPKYELDGLLDVLSKRRLVELSENEVSILGVTTRGVLQHAADMFDESNPNPFERAAIVLGEEASIEPIRYSEVASKIGDEHKLTSVETEEFLDRAEQIGFVDVEGEGADRLLFNGNLFKRDSVMKAARVIDSLNTDETNKVREVAHLLESHGCVRYGQVEGILGESLFEKLKAAGLYDVSIVGNETGSHPYVTLPGAFHKFVNPLVDDVFDMAKALVSALMYGIQDRNYSVGKIFFPTILINKLIKGGEVGPATAIGADYRVLEINRVVAIRRDISYPDRFFLRLLKREIGVLALEVLTTGDASASSLRVLPGSPMSSYTGPEESRVAVRKRQTQTSKTQTRDVLNAIRGGGRS
jgi:hypothetical protein